MKWEIFSVILLSLLSANTGLLLYTTQPKESIKLLLWANHSAPSDNFVAISELPYGKEIWALANASLLTHVPIEITEESLLREWAESMLKNDSRAYLTIKNGEEYYSLGIGYFSYTIHYPKEAAIIFLAATICAWTVYAIVWLLPKK